MWMHKPQAAIEIHQVVQCDLRRREIILTFLNFVVHPQIALQIVVLRTSATKAPQTEEFMREG